MVENVEVFLQRSGDCQQTLSFESKLARGPSCTVSPWSLRAEALGRPERVRIRMLADYVDPSVPHDLEVGIMPESGGSVPRRVDAMRHVQPGVYSAVLSGHSYDRLTDDHVWHVRPDVGADAEPDEDSLPVRILLIAGGSLMAIVFLLAFRGLRRTG